MVSITRVFIGRNFPMNKDHIVHVNVEQPSTSCEQWLEALWYRIDGSRHGPFVGGGGIFLRRIEIHSIIMKQGWYPHSGLTQQQSRHISRNRRGFQVNFQRHKFMKLSSLVFKSSLLLHLQTIGYHATRETSRHASTPSFNLSLTILVQLSIQSSCSYLYMRDNLARPMTMKEAISQEIDCQIGDHCHLYTVLKKF